MKVLKFGGSSVATPQAIQQVRQIVQHTAAPMVIVVSALGGVTDQLIALSHQATKGGDDYLPALEPSINVIATWSKRWSKRLNNQLY